VWHGFAHCGDPSAILAQIATRVSNLDLGRQAGRLGSHPPGTIRVDDGNRDIYRHPISSRHG
ncbi:hypothetical protein NL474_30870, partial [Klebsiella pneumoniae]|nr:hypothetical protein [Klebsiella pneumoniae]